MEVKTGQSLPKRLGLHFGAIACVTCFAFGAIAGPAPTGSSRITASDTAELARFGDSIAIDGDVAIVGATGDNENGTLSGAVYAFHRGKDGVWAEEQKLLATDGSANDLFGFSVDLLNDLAIVGAYRDNENGSGSGSAYVFLRAPNGVWTQETKLIPLDGSTQDRFGFNVSIGVGFEGIAACVSSYLDDAAGFDSGSAYIFERDLNGVWTETDKFQGSDTEDLDSFGWSVDIDSDSAMIGAYLDDDLGDGAGAVYFFRRDLFGDWAQFQKIMASDGQAVDNFGIDVAIDSPLAVVGAYLDDDNGSEAGAAYVFRFNGSAWVEETKLLAPDGQPGDEFGRHVSIKGSRIVVGAELNDELGSESGAAYVYQFTGGQWVLKNKLGSTSPEDFSEFGHSVGIDGDDVIVGAWRENGVAIDDAGAAYVYDTSLLGCLGDLNSDGVVDTADLGLVLSAFGSPDVIADINGDGVVDTADLGLLLGAFGSTCS
jgi:hypothetical protein